MRRLALVLALLAVLALPFGAVASASPGGDVDTAVPPSASIGTVDNSPGGHAVAQTTAPGDRTASTEMTVQLQEDRDARWTIDMSYPLESDDETAAFRQYGEAYEDGEADGAVAVDTFEHLAASSSTVADREMRIQNVSRSATVSDDVGVLTLSFTWTEFLSADGDQLVLRDALLLPNDRTWLATLGSNQRLVIETPPGYSVNATNAPVVQRSGTVVIDGPRSFDTGDPLTIRYEPTTGVAGYPWEIVAGIAVALVVILLVFARRRDVTSGTAVPDGISGTLPTSDSESEAEPGAESDVPPSRGDPSTPDSTTGGDSSSGVGPTPGPGAGGAELEGRSPASDLSLLSDEERVERLLDRNDGRMRQADIVSETGWSDAKVSQLLSSMAEEGRIEKLRLGRENLISLPDDADDDA